MFVFSIFLWCSLDVNRPLQFPQRIKVSETSVGREEPHWVAAEIVFPLFADLGSEGLDQTCLHLGFIPKLRWLIGCEAKSRTRGSWAWCRVAAHMLTMHLSLAFYCTAAEGQWHGRALPCMCRVPALEIQDLCSASALPGDAHYRELGEQMLPTAGSCVLKPVWRLLLCVLSDRAGGCSGAPSLCLVLLQPVPMLFSRRHV